MKRCAVSNDEWCCVRPARRNGWCAAHDHQHKIGNPFTPIRSIASRSQVPEREKPCRFTGCGNNRFVHGYCGGHAKQIKDGRPLSELRTRRPHPWLPGWGHPWGGANRGYKQTIHTETGRRVAEHRAVMEWILGRELTGDENVHHINGDRLDNRPENLELWSTLQPCGQRIPDKVAFAWEIIRRYDPDHLGVATD